MPVGAIIGAGVLTAGATVYASSKNSSAIDKSTAAQQQSEAQQVALQRDVYNNNSATLSPYVQRGNAAGDQINALLGLGAPAIVSAPGQQGLPTAQPANQMGPGSNQTYARWMDAGGPPEPFGNPTPQAQGSTTPATPAQTPAQSAAAAYETFKQSTGYQTRLQEGQRTLSSNYFGGGVGQSGAAVKAALKYGQNYASNEFGNYMGYLGNQQGVGLSGASALAGVGQNYANNMGQISQNGANVQSQAAIARAQNSGALMGGLAGIAGQTVGALSSYRPPTNLYASANAAMNANPGIF